jgi:hypothetical protein
MTSEGQDRLVFMILGWEESQEKWESRFGTTRFAQGHEDHEGRGGRFLNIACFAALDGLRPYRTA